MNRKNYYSKYCVGCGICSSIKGLNFTENEKGFLSPEFENADDEILGFCDSVCPASKRAVCNLDFKENIWGRAEEYSYAYSNDKSIRKRASSGGVLTAMSIYLLESGKVDGILHSGVSKSSVIETSTYCSTNVDEVISHCGSRYSISSPLMDIFNLIEKGKKYAFIGKPCDVTALKNYMSINEEYNDSILYTLAFFCAGIPSREANALLLNKLGCSIDNSIELTYRGNGWPGKATVVDNQGIVHEIDYETAWGKVLGRDIHTFCRFCMDGIGEAADISCGDAWYLNSDNTPDFSDHEGRNIVISRTSKGKSLIDEATEFGYITKTKFGNLDELKSVQTYQFDRKSTMLYKILALKLLLKTSPQYPIKHLLYFSKYTTPKKAFKILIGTLKRSVLGKL